MTVFIRRAPVEDNTTSECVRTVAATYGCKILQLYEYDANVYGYDNNTSRIPVRAAKKTVDYQLSCLKSGVEFDMNDILYEFKNLHHF